MRAALLLSLTILAGCQGLTELTPERVPPPDRRRVPEGTLDDPSDPCGALDVGAARRLSASIGDSDGSRMALLTRPGSESWVAVAWLEHGVEGDSPARVAVQVLLEDGTPFGDALYVDAVSPYLVDVTTRTGSDSFLVASSHLDRGSIVREVELRDGEWTSDDTPVLLPNLERARLLVAQEKLFVAGVEERGDVSIAELALPLEEGAHPSTTRLPDLQAVDVALATNGPTIWLAWNEGGGLGVQGGALVKGQSEGWEIPFENRIFFQNSYQGDLRAAHGTRNLVLASSSLGYTVAYRLDVVRWVEVAQTDPGGQSTQQDEALPIARGEAGARWAIARTYAPDEDAPTEIRIERAHPSQYLCATPGECARVTTDLQESTAPEIIGVDGGYLVSWSNRLEDDQTDVFVAFVACRATTRPD